MRAKIAFGARLGEFRADRSERRKKHHEIALAAAHTVNTSMGVTFEVARLASGGGEMRAKIAEAEACTFPTTPHRSRRATRDVSERRRRLRHHAHVGGGGGGGGDEVVAAATATWRLQRRPLVVAAVARHAAHGSKRAARARQSVR